MKGISATTVQRKWSNFAINLAGIACVFLLLLLVKEGGFLSRYAQGVVMQCCYAIIMAASLNIVMGFLGQIALGHAGFMAVGAYTSALVTKAIRQADILTGRDFGSQLLLFVIGIACGALMAALFGLLVGVPALRLRGDYLAIITLGFGEIIRIVIQNLPIAGGRGLSEGQAGQALIGIPTIANLYVVFFLMVAVVSLLFMFTRGKYGRAIKAIREDDVASEASGINNTRFKVMAFTVAAAFAGVAGSIFAHRGLGTLQYNDFTFMKSTEFVLMVVLGGMGSLTGSVIAAVVLSVLPELLRSFADFRMLIYAVVLILLMVFRPTGLCGSWEFSLTRAIKGGPAFIRSLPQRARGCVAWWRGLPARVRARKTEDGEEADAV